MWLQATDITWLNFDPSTGNQFSALEHCGKCKTFQGGQTTFVQGARLVKSSSLARWAWPHQGIFLDVDGSLLGQPAGRTLHAGENGLLEGEPLCSPSDPLGSPEGWVCGPELVFRRVMLNGHKPNALRFYDLLVTLPETNSTSVVSFTKYNDNGYQWTNVVGRDHWLHWDLDVRTDPEKFQLHESEQMDPSSFMLFHTRHTRQYDHFTVNGDPSSPEGFAMPMENNTHGAAVYDAVLRENKDSGMMDTRLSVFVSGTSYDRLRVEPSVCPTEGCPEGGLIPEPEEDYREGQLLWSDPSTWQGSDGGDQGFMPQEGDDVIIPAGWDVVLDTSTPKLGRVTIAGNLTFGKADVELRAAAVLVAWGGALNAGSPEEPHSYRAAVVLHGNKDSEVLAVDNDLIPGAKVLAAIKGGNLNLHGRRHTARWTRLASTAETGSQSLQLSEAVDWPPGSQVVVSSSSFNPDQAEVVTVAEVAAEGFLLLLETSLAHTHEVVVSEPLWEGGPPLGAEVGLLESNVVIESDDGEFQNLPPIGPADPYRGQKFGAYVLAHGDGTSLQLSNVAFNYCGQFGVSDGNGCVRVMAGNLSPGSFIDSCAVNVALDHGFRVEDGSSGLRIADNVLYSSHDMHTVHVGSPGSAISRNLVVGTSKTMSGKSSFDSDLPASFSIMAPGKPPPPMKDGRAPPFSCSHMHLLSFSCMCGFRYGTPIPDGLGVKLTLRVQVRHLCGSKTHAGMYYPTSAETSRCQARITFS